MRPIFEHPPAYWDSTLCHEGPGGHSYRMMWEVPGRNVVCFTLWDCIVQTLYCHLVAAPLARVRRAVGMPNVGSLP